MLVDPEINLCAQVGERIYAYEVCDPCEADANGYQIDGVLVSDFVTPTWFQPTPQPGGPFDFQEKIPKPLGLLPGGQLHYPVPPSNTGLYTVPTPQNVRIPPG